VGGTSRIPKRLTGAALKSWLDVLNMVVNLRRFESKQWISRAEWDAMHPEWRVDMIHGGYVMVGHERIYLTIMGLQVLSYKESTG
jgi:hypothetical protein